jgi:hypothetical protein
MRFEEGDQRGQQHRVGGAPPKLIRPDSGQVEEALRPPLVTKRCRQRGEGKSLSVIW